MADTAQLGPTTVVLARCTLPLSTVAVRDLCNTYAEECHRVGYGEPWIVTEGPLYQAGYLTIAAVQPAEVVQALRRLEGA